MLITKTCDRHGMRTFFKLGRSSIIFIFTLQTYKVKGLTMVYYKGIRMRNIRFKKQLWNGIVYICVTAINIFSLEITPNRNISKLQLFVFKVTSHDERAF